jgi:Transcriptional activator of glycolytic enzymes
MVSIERKYLPRLACFMDFYKRTDIYESSWKEKSLIFTSEADFTNMTAAFIEGKTFIKKEELYGIVPEDIEHFMVVKAFGLENHLVKDIPEDARVKHWRSSTAEYFKKALSHFMPNRNIQWNEITKIGNPTKSVAVNNVVQLIKKKELRGLGLDPQARRELEPGEFEMTLRKLNTYKRSIVKQFMIPAVIKFQFAMIARIDDTCHFLEKDLKRHPKFPFALCAKLRWSKNVVDERDVADQILLGAMNRLYCILLALSIYLEVWTESMKGIENGFLFGSSNNPLTNKTNISDTLVQSVWDQPDFTPETEGPIGTHSIRKYPATQAGNTCSLTEVETRGRWKRAGGRIVNRYISNRLPYSDAKVAAALCIGGPCKYSLKENSGVTDEWLLAHVVPNTFAHSKFQNNEHVALVLALPLLWASFDSEMDDFIPTHIKTRIQNAYEPIRRLPPEENPVARIPLLIASNENGILCIDPIVLGADAESSNTAHINRELVLLQALYTRSLASQHENQELRTQNQQLRTLIHDINTNVNDRLDLQTAAFKRILRRALLQPAHPIQQAAPNAILPNAAVDAPPPDAVFHDAAQDDDNIADIVPRNALVARPARLCRKPESLFVLWQEWEVGIGGNLAAKHFNEKQRGACKFMYCRRKIVWDQIRKMINSTYYDANTAIDAIYAKYGLSLDVTAITKALRQDLKVANAAGHDLEF